MVTLLALVLPARMAVASPPCAETDTVGRCTNLEDSKDAINKKVNEVLNKARKAAGNNVQKLIDEVYKELGEGIGWSKIEKWATTENLGKGKVSEVTQATSKYKGVDANDAPLWGVALFSILNPAIKVNGICIGTDKLGHFFQQGYEYYKIAGSDEKKDKEAIEWGEKTEAGGFGLETTGIYSNADLEANLAGLKFYRDLEKNPNMNFDISKYITEKWNEESNPNFYAPSVAKKVWANLVAGQWKGSLGTAPITITLKVEANFADVTGSYEYPKDGKIITGTLTAGKITQIIEKKRGVDAVTGIKIDFTWKEGSRQGQASLKSKNEHVLEGQWDSDVLKCTKKPSETVPPTPTTTPTPTPTSASPEIISIDFPSQIPADGSSIDGKVRFRDPEGDVNLVTFEVISATDFTPFEFNPLDSLDEGDATEGVFTFYIWTTTVQEVTLRVTLYDVSGNNSTPIDFSFNCE